MTASPRAHDPEDRVCGDTWEFLISLTDGAGDPLDPDDIVAIAWTLDDVAATTRYAALSLNAGVTLDVDPPSVSALVTVPSATTGALTPGVYRDWLRVTLTDGSIDTQLSGIIRANAGPA